MITKGAVHLSNTSGLKHVQTTGSICNPPTQNDNTDVHTQKRGSKLVDPGGEFEQAPYAPPQYPQTVEQGEGGGKKYDMQAWSKTATDQWISGSYLWTTNVQVQTTFTVQLPLLQLTYAKYMKVHDTKQQLLGFPIFRRGANWSQRGLYTEKTPAGSNTYRTTWSNCNPPTQLTTQIYIPKSGVAN